ncbi:hypothetical protein BCR37DRAFT_394115 [Protomyces lactucae-debilis]|uniref:Uncharacterized protein n=1 Tax=Protomyces lactucae-debilis TaxID=2754530 RepID=A0A1Y2F7Q2_PROLT|nr:uncharacterized protein BCR37DRAFT_394115 [Protomyces lactucae-debilis]ORY79376.1 hypothetical protein BCR37DRAFT_394115 [Protomyces lactucae-debilis]
MSINGHHIFEDLTSNEMSSSSWQSTSSVPRHLSRASAGHKFQGLTASVASMWDDMDAWHNPFDPASRSSSISSVASKSHPLQRLLFEEKHILNNANAARPSAHEVYHRRTRSNSVSMARPRPDTLVSGTQMSGAWCMPGNSQATRPGYKGRAMSTSVLGSSPRGSQVPHHALARVKDEQQEWAVGGDSD